MATAEVADQTSGSDQPLFEVLPVIVLQQHILSHTSAHTICKVAVCSKFLYNIATADALWQQLCEERNWGPFDEGTSWHQGFCIEYMKLCVECKQPTRYIFKLLGCRLCEKCEFEHPKYGLVTTAEATERYSLSLSHLGSLDFVPFRTTRLYLRSAVIRIAAAGIAGVQLAGSGRRPSPAAAQASRSAVSEEEEEEEEGKGHRRDGSSEDEAEQVEDLHIGGTSELSAEEAAARKAAEKAARKAHKKQFKAEQRQKRQMKAAGERSGGQSPIFGSSPPSASPSSWPGPHRSRTPSQGSTPPGRGFAPGSSPPGPSSFVPGSSPPSGSFFPGSSPSGRRGKGPRQRHQRPHKVWSEDGTHVVSGKKVVSSWLAERQQLMAEWGEYALSGLVLAS